VIHCNQNSTVNDLREIIFDSEGTPPSKQRLIFAGKQLEDGYLLNHYGICEHSTIHMVLNLRGGMFHHTSGRSGNYQPLAVKPKIFFVGLTNEEINLIETVVQG
jgi:hypothetical protein